MTLFFFFFLSFESESEGASESVIIVCRESEEFGERLVLKLIVYPFVRQELFAESEIGEHDVSLGVEQNVLQFDVAVNDAQLQVK